LTQNINSNLFEALIKSIDKNTGITFIDNKGSRILSYRELLNKCLGIAGFLTKKINPTVNDTIILLDSNKEFVPVFWACIAAKIKAVPVAVGSSDEHKLKLFKVWENLNVPYLVTSQSVFNNLCDFAEQNGLEKKLDEIKQRLVLYNDIYEIDNFVCGKIEENDIAFIQYSSGSTGMPKGVILTHKNLVITTSAYIKKSKINSNDSFLSWFPLTHDMGLIGWHIVPIIAGINQVIIETNVFVRRPALWMDKSSEYKSTILCSPNFGLKHFLSFTKKLDNADWDLSNVRMIANGAEPISPKLCEEFLNALSRYKLKHSVMTPGYGMAEVGLIASISDYASDFETIHVDRNKLNVGDEICEIDKTSLDCISFVCEGDFIPEMKAKITDGKGKVLAENYVGHICLKGKSVTSGYYNNKIVTSQIIKQGWLDTGDLGFLKNNKLYLTGRSKELIIINGYNYYPHDIERICLSIAELELGKVIAAGSFEETINQEALLIFVYYKNNLDNFFDLAKKIKNVILKNIGIVVYKVIPVKKIPKTTSGKIQRFILLEHYKKGAYDEVLSTIDLLWNSEDKEKSNGDLSIEFVSEKIKSLAESVVNIKDVDPDTLLINFGIDSIRGTELLGIIRDEFGITFDDFIYLPDLSLNAAAEIIVKNTRNRIRENKTADTKPEVYAEEKIYPASSGQFSIYYHYKNFPQSPAYNISIACRILNKIDYKTLNEAYKYVLNRHDILCARFSMTDSLYYRVNESIDEIIKIIEIDEVDFDKLKSIIKKDAEVPFDIESNSVVRANLYRTRKYGSIFLINLHHIAGDARSLFVLLNEILTCYNELKKYNEIKSLPQSASSQYPEYIERENNYLNSHASIAAKEYWKSSLSDVNFTFNFPDASGRKKGDGSTSIMFDVEFEKDSLLKNVSNYVLMFSVYCFLLHRYTQQKEIVVGIPIADGVVVSDKTMNEELVGYTVNTLPIKSKININETVSEYIERMKQTILDAMKHQKYPLAKIADDINTNRNIGDLLNTMFTSIPVSSKNKLAGLADSIDEERQIGYGELQLKPFYIPQQECLFDFSMEMVEHAGKNIFRISYNGERYDKEFILRFASHYQSALREFNTSPSKNISKVEFLSSEEKLLLELFNDTKKNCRNYKPIINLIEDQVVKTPGNTAYVFDGKQFTYEWINKKANGIADEILKHGITQGDFIPLFMKKGIELPLSLLAIMKAGCAFIPIDVDSPSKRLEIFINDINPKIILTTNKYSNQLSFIESSKIFLVDTNEINEVDENLGIDISLDDPIYGIYTSGSTGIPKCAVNLQRGITNRFLYMDDYFGKDEQRVVYHSANYIFDTSVYQLFWALTHGAKVVIPKSSDKLNLDYMLDLIAEYKISYIDLVPSVFNILVEYFESNPEAKNKFGTITHLSIGGEAIVPAFVRRFIKHFPNVIVTNIYGPTETAIGVTFYDVKNAENEIPIGKPLSNIQIFILDENMNQLPIGITGGIYIGGECVGSGYSNRPKQTAEVFVDNPFGGMSKLYRTGDAGCFLPDGNILFKGRADEQVKIRGVRIELDEIRTNILNNDAVRDVVVAANNDGNSDIQLAAYVVLKDNNYSLSELKNELAKNLPEIFIPQNFVKIDKIPLNANGKIDKRALPVIKFDKNQFKKDKEAGSSKLLNIWREVLGIENINTNDKFFDCGGNSLKALLLKIKIQQNYGIELGIENILNNPTIAQLDRILDNILPDAKNKIPTAASQEYYSLSTQQKRMWLLCNGKDVSRAYGIIGVFHINGNVELPLIKKSWEVLTERHESLRTKHNVVNGEPVQIIKNECVIDYKEIVSEDISNELQNVITSEKKYSFDLSNLPLFRIIAISNGKENTKLIIHLHHIITDGWSIKKMFGEFEYIYNNLIRNRELKLDELQIQYKDYSVWFNNELENGKFQEAKEYWGKKLSGELPRTSVPKDYDITKTQGRSAGVKRFLIGNGVFGKYYEFCKENEITLFMLMICAIEIVLSKHSNSEEIILGTPVSGRVKPEFEEQLGLFVNTIVLRSKVDRNETCYEFIAGLKKEILEAYKYQDYPYDEMIGARGNKNVDLFDVFVSYEGIGDEIKLLLESTESKYEEIENEEYKFNFNIMFREKAEGIELIIEYAKELYKEKRIELFASHIEKTLEEIINEPQKKIGSIKILGKAEEERLLRYSLSSAKEDLKWESVVEQFKNAVKKNENNTAVFYSGKKYTYKQLNIESDKVASELLAKGIKDECVVGLLTTKSFDMIAGIFGILKVGAAYLPLDINNPIERLKLIVQDSECKVVLTDVEDYSQSIFACEVLNLNHIKNITDIGNISKCDIKPSQLAYVIYTSGSTGAPKGAMIEHHSLNNLIRSLRNDVYDKYGDRLNVALQASQVFDASIQQIFPALVRGDALHLVDDETKLNGKLISEYFNKYKINVADVTPTLFDLQLQNSFAGEEHNSLKHLLIGGEALSHELLNRFFSNGKNNHVKITNMYGPTECCVDTVCCQITKETCEQNGTVPIGKPMLNTAAYILDEDMQIVPEGIAGELYLLGDNVGRGYLNNEEITKTKFVQSQFDKNKKLYRTGDLCRYSFDGNIIYLGRIDNQVKIRGYRVELGEIENVIEDLLSPSKCIVVFNKDELTAFVERRNGEGLITNEIFEKVKRRLPNYMHPAKFIEIEKLPLTSSGKPDRNRLKENVRNYNAVPFNKKYEPPKNETEKKLIEIWKNILGVDEIGIRDNFYELGGHSLKSLKIMSEVVKEFGVEINYKDILINSTIKELAELIDSLEVVQYKPIPKIEEKEYYLLSHAQKRIWLECELGRSQAYNIIGGFRLFGKLDTNLLEKSFCKIFQRHESLRTKFKMVDGEAKQFICTLKEIAVGFIDYSEKTNAEELLQNEIRKAASKSLNIFCDDLVNISLLKLNDEEYYLLALIHHILTDGWSIKIMLEELSEIYNSYKTGTTPGLKELAVQYKDYSVWFESEIKSKKYKRAENYWHEKIIKDFVPMPADKRKTKPTDYTGKVKRTELDKSLVHAIHEYAETKEITSFVFLVSIIEIVLYKYSGSEDVVVGTPVSGRNHPDLERQLGLYTNTILLKNKISDSDSYSEFIKELKSEILESFNYQDYPFDRLMEENRERNDGGLFNVFIGYESEEDEIKLELDGIKTKYEEIETGTSKFDIGITFRERKNNIELSVDYSTAKYDVTDINKFVEDIKSVASSIINDDEQKISAFYVGINTIEKNIDVNKLESEIKVDKPKSGKNRLPKTIMEKEIASLWKNVLDLKRIGIKDNFFELGGQSIKALQLVTLLKQKYNINLELNFVFANQTITEQAAEIGNIIWVSNSADNKDGEEMII
jgi:amino acid adenylation domain-containing protein